jgi:hypothetical protein
MKFLLTFLTHVFVWPLGGSDSQVEIFLSVRELGQHLCGDLVAKIRTPDLGPWVVNHISDH